MTDQKNALTSRTVLLSLFGFVILWAILTDAWGYSARLGTDYGSLIYACVSRLIWVAPAVWLIVRHSASLSFGRKELFSRPVWNKPLAVVLSVSLAVTVVGMLATHGGLWLNPEINIPFEIIKICFVGFVEETVFRGWGYNALFAAATDKKAVFYSTLFFVLLHAPAYFVRFYRFGTLDHSTWLIQSLTALIWGVVFCWLLKRSRTVWDPFIAHIVYDVLAVLFVG